MRSAAVTTLAAPLFGCFNSAAVPYLGRWEGKFVVQTVDPRLPIHDPTRNDLKGFIQLYRTEDSALGHKASRCTVHLDGEQEAVDLKGHWELRRNQIVLTFSEIKIDDAGGIDLRDPNKAFIPATGLKAAFSNPLPLTIGPSKKSLRSPLTVIGPLTGYYEFSKEALPH